MGMGMGIIGMKQRNGDRVSPPGMSGKKLIPSGPETGMGNGNDPPGNSGKKLGMGMGIIGIETGGMGRNGNGNGKV